MDRQHQTLPVSLLTCQACGRRTPLLRSNDADPTTAAAEVYCPSCGSSALLPATPTYGISPSTETTTASLTPAVEQPDRYQTAAAVDPVWPAFPSAPPGELRTQPVAAPLPTSAPPTAGRRILWVGIGAGLVLVLLFATGILLSQNGSGPRPTGGQNPTQPSGTATALVPEGFALKMDQEKLYTFAVPESWTPVPGVSSSATTETTAYTDPARDSIFEVLSFTDVTGPQGAALDAQVLQEQHYKSINDLSQPSSLELDGETWIQEAAQVSSPATPSGPSQVYNAEILTTQDNGTTFIIFYNSLATGASSSSNRGLLQEILHTFSFVG